MIDALAPEGVFSNRVASKQHEATSLLKFGLTSLIFCSPEVGMRLIQFFRYRMSCKDPRTLLLRIVLRELNAAVSELRMVRFTQNAQLELPSLHTSQKLKSLQLSRSARQS